MSPTAPPKAKPRIARLPPAPPRSPSSRRTTTECGAASLSTTASPAKSRSITRATSFSRLRPNRSYKDPIMQTVSRVYDTYAQARNAVTAVEAAGVPTSAGSLGANKNVSDKYADVDEVSAPAKGAGIGGAIGGGAGPLARVRPRGHSRPRRGARAGRVG